MKDSDQSCSVKRKTSMSSPLSGIILASTLFFAVLASWMIGSSVKGAYATSASRSSPSLPFSLPLRGDRINKHQVRIAKK